MNSGAPKDWSLHAQLEQDTVPVGDLPLARVLLANDANYPWLILVPRLPGLLNIAALGNQVPQLHVHVIARRHTDAAWPKPVWGVQPPISYDEGQQRILIEALRQLLKPRELVGLDC
jgi:HIT domain